MSTTPQATAPLGVVEEVGDGIFAYIQPDGTWWINNTAFLVGRRGVAAIDACATEARTRGFLDAIRSRTTAPVRTLVNTHHHGDHTHGNCLFDTATIVETLQSFDPDSTWTAVVPPDDTATAASG